MIVVLLFMVVPLASSNVPMKRGPDPLLVAIDDVQGLLYDIPDYEDPEIIQHQLSSLGVMPIFTALDKVKKYETDKDEEIIDKTQIAEAKKSINDVINKLQLIESKLEKGNSNIYVDLEKSIQNLKKVEKNFRPDIRQVLGSLRAALSISKPIAKPIIQTSLQTTITPVKFFSSTTQSQSTSLVIDDIPDYESLKKYGMSLKVVSNGKPAVDDAKIIEQKVNVKMVEKQKLIDGPKLEEYKTTGIPVETTTQKSVDVTIKPYEIEPYRKRNKNNDYGDVVPNMYNQNWNWKIAEEA